MGFDRDFALLDGGGSYWDMTNLTARTPHSLFTEDGPSLASASAAAPQEDHQPPCL